MTSPFFPVAMVIPLFLESLSSSKKYLVISVEFIYKSQELLE